MAGEEEKIKDSFKAARKSGHDLEKGTEPTDTRNETPSMH